MKALKFTVLFSDNFIRLLPEIFLIIIGSFLLIYGVLWNKSKLLNGQIILNQIMGFSIFAIIISIVSMYWFQDIMLGLIIGLAMVLNLILAGFAGTIIPLTLDKFKIDPALASGVILTTITDVFGFLSFLGLASIFLF